MQCSKIEMPNRVRVVIVVVVVVAERLCAIDIDVCLGDTKIVSATFIATLYSGC